MQPKGQRGTRPALGQRVRARDRLVRDWRYVEREARDERYWRRAGERRRGRPPIPGWEPAPAPVEGMYIGYRTFSNGRAEWTGDSWGYVPQRHFEVWLVVPSDRENPVPVLPEDVELVNE